ncbi:MULTISPECIES: hypothetical protein [Leisingera]|uniref:hypothetical protein n=1 Tax=Leisingera TaxID=191028 RepID=UPI001150233E|nr:MULTISPECIES: hypothetical protein [Leisingera]
MSAAESNCRPWKITFVIPSKNVLLACRPFIRFSADCPAGWRKGRKCLSAVANLPVSFPVSDASATLAGAKPAVARLLRFPPLVLPPDGGGKTPFWTHKSGFAAVQHLQRRQSMIAWRRIGLGD